MAKIIILIIVLIILTAYATSRICNQECKSKWLIIKLQNDSIEPTYIFVCENCHQHEENNYRYCKNCGSRMMNGMERQFYRENIEI